jgi:hypothetical protein
MARVRATAGAEGSEPYCGKWGVEQHRMRPCQRALLDRSFHKCGDRTLREIAKLSGVPGDRKGLAILTGNQNQMDA